MHTFNPLQRPNGIKGVTLVLDWSADDDVVAAYKGLTSEKEALEASLKAFSGAKLTNSVLEKIGSDAQKKKTVNTDVKVVERSSSETEMEKEKEVETVDHLRAQLKTLMNSLATLSAEKSRMEASFQADKKQLRSGREEQEKCIKELQEKLSQSSYLRQSEIDDLKSRLIIERHERDKDQNNHGVMIKELQKLLGDERRAKEHLESQVEDLSVRVAEAESLGSLKDHYEKRLRDLHNELEATHRKLKRTENKAKEPPPLLLELQEEMSNLKVQHQAAILQDQLALLEINESTVVSNKHSRPDLEKDLKGKSETDLSQDVQCLLDQIMQLKKQLLLAIERSEKPVDIQGRVENYLEKKPIPPEQDSNLDLPVLGSPAQDKTSVSKEHGTELVALRSQVKTLKDRISILNAQLSDSEKECSQRIEHEQKMLKAERMRHKEELIACESQNLSHLSQLEQQLQKQRERSLVLLEEKEQELKTLKSTFQMFLPDNKNNSLQDKHVTDGAEVVDDVMSSLSQFGGVVRGGGGESPHMLHYVHELARRDVEISNQRRSRHQLESSLRELQKVAFEKEEKANKLQEQVTM
uniref:Uncharacterized protein n=1 Tax=Timema poppense TaxID=170557 RepID=A0A7R9H2H1_TIMPO|nr:unnamed protein product [Timema poppensis]